MTVPYKFKFNPYTKYFKSMDWVKLSLDVLGGRGHIGEFRYAPIVGPDILSGVLVKATGQSVLYLRNGLRKAHRNRADGNSVICHTDIYGGLEKIKVMRLWATVGILFTSIQRREW